MPDKLGDRMLRRIYVYGKENGVEPETVVVWQYLPGSAAKFRTATVLTAWILQDASTFQLSRYPYRLFSGEMAYVV